MFQYTTFVDNLLYVCKIVLPNQVALDIKIYINIESFSFVINKLFVIQFFAYCEFSYKLYILFES